MLFGIKYKRGKNVKDIMSRMVCFRRIHKRNILITSLLLWSLVCQRPMIRSQEFQVSNAFLELPVILSETTFIHTLYHMFWGQYGYPRRNFLGKLKIRIYRTSVYNLNCLWHCSNIFLCGYVRMLVATMKIESGVLCWKLFWNSNNPIEQCVWW